MNDEVVVAIWRRRVGWSRAADSLKAAMAWARLSALILSSAGAILATLAATLLTDIPFWRTASAAAGAVLVAAATFVTTRFITTDALRAWTRTRSVSEAIKAEVYSYRASAAPYTGADATQLLLDRVQEVEEAAHDLERHVAAARVPSDVRPPPALSPEDYITSRVIQQIERYYRPKAKLYADRLAWFQRVELVLGLIATILGALAAFISGTTEGGDTATAAWVAVFTTLGAALAAHVAASRYYFLVVSYYATARRLEGLVNNWRAQGAPDDPERWSTFVKNCEDAISIENESWLAKWAEQEGGSPGR